MCSLRFQAMPKDAPREGEAMLRWQVASDDGGQPALFPHEDGWQPGRGELAGLELLYVRARRAINRVPEQSRQPFRWTVNPYRGCSHACVYCFARPTHEYLGLGIGDDFDRRLVVKVNAAEQVRAELASPHWAGESVALGTNTDPYQPLEKRFRLTRGVLEALADAGNPFSVLTKSPLILRDIDVLRKGAARADVGTALSVGTPAAPAAAVSRNSRRPTPLPAFMKDLLSRSVNKSLLPRLPSKARPATIHEARAKFRLPRPVWDRRPRKTHRTMAMSSVSGKIGA